VSMKIKAKDIVAVLDLAEEIMKRKGWDFKDDFWKAVGCAKDWLEAKRYFEKRRIKCVVCGDKFLIHDYPFYGYIKGEPICYLCCRYLGPFLDIGFKPSDVKDQK